MSGPNIEKLREVLAHARSNPGFSFSNPHECFIKSFADIEGECLYVGLSRIQFLSICNPGHAQSSGMVDFSFPFESHFDVPNCIALAVFENYIKDLTLDPEALADWHFTGFTIGSSHDFNS